MAFTALRERKRYKMVSITKENTVTKIKGDVKQEVIEFIMESLREKYGEDSVAMVRTGNSTSKTNEIGVIIDTADNNGDENPICVTINPTVKEFANRKTDKRTYVPFDFAAAKDAYITYLEDKAIKDEENARNKAKKIANDEARRKTKTEDVED